MIFDPMYMLITLAIMAMMGLASKGVQATFARYSQVPIRSGMNGARAARYILDANGLQDIRIERVAGELTDHYDPSSRVLRLSSVVYDQPSVASVGVAAHEAGHALQDKVGYLPLKLRQGFYPLAMTGSQLGMILIMAGIFLQFAMGQFGIMLGIAGVLFYAMSVLFTIITLPVEFDASRRAMVCLNQYGIVTSEEHAGTGRVLRAAALTYVAAAIGSILMLLYYASFFIGGRRD
ncbi:MAG: hypothetical protein GC154_02925 [bacterium]|nr:hypothetical protein [bacterium]